MIALWLAGALAGEASVDLAAEVVPDAFGRTQQRALVDLDLDHEEDDVRIVARGGVRQWTAPDLAATPIVQRLGVQWSPRGVSLAAGRLVHMDARGVKRLDGLTADAEAPSGRASLSAWGGRIWRPERSAAGTLLVGVEGRLHPERVATSSVWIGGAIGGEARVSEAARGRLWGAVTARSPRGDRASLVAEVDPTRLSSGRGALRAGVEGGVPLAASWTVIADVRWNGLRPHGVPDGERTPMDWVAPDGYGVANIGVAWAGTHGGVVTIAPVARPEPNGGVTVGGSVGASLDVVDGDVPITMFCRAATVSVSHLAGGGATASGQLGAVSWHGTGALWHWRGIDELPAIIGEARARAELPLGDTGITVRGQVSAGGDRVLQRWIRGGMAIGGSL